jgi:ATP-dependent DNA helicase RecG
MRVIRVGPASGGGARVSSEGVGVTRRTTGQSPRTKQLPTAPAAHAPPLGPADFLDAPIGESGLAAIGVLKRTLPRLGVSTVRDLLFHLPRRYDDLRELHSLGELQWGVTPDGEVASARGNVVSIEIQPTFRRRVQRTTAVLRDGTGVAHAVWFGRRFIERRLAAGQDVVVSGRIRHRNGVLQFEDPDFQVDDGSALLHAGRIVPVYRLTAGLNVARLRAAVREALDRGRGGFAEYLASGVREDVGLPGIGDAVEAAHFPASFEARDAALRRLAFDELLAVQVGMVGRRRERGRSRAISIPVADERDRAVREAIAASLVRKVGRPVELTEDQASAMTVVRADLARTEPMLRLLQGDVGSGKTAVAAHALALAALDGRQGALLAPTDLLARQHLETIGDLLADLALPVELLVGSLGADQKREVHRHIASGQARIVVGTHALLTEAVTFADLGMVVIDEQHRFGVEQRGQLEAKASGAVPHVLLMTATPIPRTVGQVLYADLDVSDLRTPPAGRIAIRTGVKHPSQLDGTWDKVRSEAEAGRRTFVVVPLIVQGGEAGTGDDEAEDLAGGAVAAESEKERLTALLAPHRVGMVHGRLKPSERDAEMARFRDGEVDILVGTTVVEVGVDVPEATMMVVEGAERFGLAQLHQLRGRVGRGRVESFCVLVSDSDDPVARARLKALVETQDGFALAEEDFKLRQEGDVLGFAQSGFPRLRVASLQRDDHRALAVVAREHAETLIGEDGELRREAGAELIRVLRSGWLARLATAEPSTGA